MAGGKAKVLFIRPCGRIVYDYSQAISDYCDNRAARSSARKKGREGR